MTEHRCKLVALGSLALGICSVLASCNRGARVQAESFDSWPVPANGDRGVVCADVGELRACWGEAARGCELGICAVPRSLPPFLPSALGWRCVGSGAERRCRDRRQGAAVFECKDARYTERHPRFPDSGEWTCADAAGAVVCLSGAPAAAVPSASIDAGFFCGLRRGSTTGERVCVDLSPDFPDGKSSGWKCRFEQQGAPLRICEGDPNAHVLGDTCDAAHPCVDGARCVSGRCLPPAPAPSCWLDADCGSGARCRFGSCLAEAS